jgi:hypothetical protein
MFYCTLIVLAGLPTIFKSVMLQTRLALLEGETCTCNVAAECIIIIIIIFFFNVMMLHSFSVLFH